MPNYQWKGKNRSGEEVNGVLVADTKDAVVNMLRAKQIQVTSVTEKGKEFSLPKFGGGVSQKEIAVFTRQFSVMIDAGLPLVQCLEILGQQIPTTAEGRQVHWPELKQTGEAGGSIRLSVSRQFLETHRVAPALGGPGIVHDRPTSEGEIEALIPNHYAVSMFAQQWFIEHHLGQAAFARLQCALVQQCKPPSGM